MKHIAILLVCALAYSLGTWAQGPIPHSQTGFDVEKAGIATPMLVVMLDGNMPSAGFNSGALKAFEAERIITDISDFKIQISNIKSHSSFDSLLLSHGVLLNK